MFSILFYILAVPAIISSVFAAGTPSVIHPDGDTTMCLDVRGAMYMNGTPVQVFVPPFFAWFMVVNLNG